MDNVADLCTKYPDKVEKLASDRYLQGMIRSDHPRSTRDRASGLTNLVARELLALQLRQLRHDELYHKDIVRLSVQDRMKHMALHMAKYAGRFCEAGITEDGRTTDRDLIDAFIIALASANALNLNLQAALAGQEDVGSDIPNSEVRFALRFSGETGRFAKACESLDHVESFPYREKMAESIANLTLLILSEGERRSLDMPHESGERLAGVKSRSIFHEFFEE